MQLEAALNLVLLYILPKVLCMTFNLKEKQKKAKKLKRISLYVNFRIHSKKTRLELSRFHVSAETTF